MHETVASPAQPRHISQLLFRMPFPLQDLVVHRARDKMVVREGHVISGTDLATGA